MQRTIVVLCVASGRLHGLTSPGAPRTATSLFIYLFFNLNQGAICVSTRGLNALIRELTSQRAPSSSLTAVCTPETGGRTSRCLHGITRTHSHCAVNIWLPSFNYGDAKVQQQSEKRTFLLRLRELHNNTSR